MGMVCEISGWGWCGRLVGGDGMKLVGGDGVRLVGGDDVRLVGVMCEIGGGW